MSVGLLLRERTYLLGPRGLRDYLEYAIPLVEHKQRKTKKMKKEKLGRTSLALICLVRSCPK
jgi:hypothetical protein